MKGSAGDRLSLALFLMNPGGLKLLLLLLMVLLMVLLLLLMVLLLMVLLAALMVRRGTEFWKRHRVC